MPLTLPIKNLASFDAAIRAVCPAIDGVAADGTIYFQPTATPAQRTAAQAAMASYVDPTPPMVPNLEQLVTELAAANVLTAAAVSRIRQPAAVPPPLPTGLPLPPVL